MRWDWRAIIGTFRDEFIAHLPRVKVMRNVLYAHFRSGNIFRIGTQTDYAQPPCNFYLEAARLDRNHSALHIITQNYANPCVRIVEQSGGVFIGNTAWDGIARLILSHRFILSRSTFAFAAAFLAPHPQVLYTFAYAWTDLGDHWDCEPTHEYKVDVLDDWKMAPHQMELLLRASCERWTEIKWNPNALLADHAHHGTPFRAD
jgi:hypothetical protein